MPTIAVDLRDMLDLVGEPVAEESLGPLLEHAKAELHRVADGVASIEVRDTGRPDLWCAEGIARQIAARLRGAPARYRCFAPDAVPAGEIHVPAASDPPFAGAFVCAGAALADRQRSQLDDLLRRLGDDFGRERRVVAIDRFDAAGVAWPLAPAPDGGGLVDANGERPRRGGDALLLVAATGTASAPLLLALNVVAANLEDRGGAVLPVMTRYARPTGLGALVPAPFDAGSDGSRDVAIRSSDVRRTLGADIPAEELVALLRGAGYEALEAPDGTVRARPAPYRLDVLDVVDVLEDVAIGRGLTTFEAPPAVGFSIGRPAPTATLADRFRDAAVGLGFDEVFSHVLTTSSALGEPTRSAGGSAAVLVANPLTPASAAVRDALVPGLLAVEAASPGVRYPHRLFEVGETLRWRWRQVETRLHAAFLVAHSGASRAELQLALEVMGDWFGTPLRVVAEAHPQHRPDRSATILAGGRHAGTLGELRPELLKAWGIAMPCAAMELDLEALAR